MVVIRVILGVENKGFFIIVNPYLKWIWFYSGLYSIYLNISGWPGFWYSDFGAEGFFRLYNHHWGYCWSNHHPHYQHFPPISCYRRLHYQHHHFPNYQDGIIPVISIINRVYLFFMSFLSITQLLLTSLWTIRTSMNP